MKTGLHVAARTFALTVEAGAPGAQHAVTRARVAEVHGDLKSTVFLLTDGFVRLCLLTSPAPMQSTEMRAAIIDALGSELGLQPEQILTLSSHNHCVPSFVEAPPPAGAVTGFKPAGSLSEPGRRLIAGLREAVRDLPAKLRPVRVEWGVAQERRFTYNRRGRRPDGSAYFIREEDRLLLGEDYTGEIDADAVTVLFRAEDRTPLAALVFFTGHPVTAYRPERMVVFGEWPQVACEELSERLGGIPVGFLQGCAGDISAKRMMTGTVEEAREFGRMLGGSFWTAVQSGRPVPAEPLQRHNATVALPLGPLPAVEELQRDLAEIDAFVRRARDGDPDTLECAGLNLPATVSPPYRARLIEMIRPWYEWALGIYARGELESLPRELPADIAVVRLGDIGIVAFPYEPFVRTGLKLRREAPLRCILPCGYSGGFSAGANGGYVPDATACGDRDYMASFHRYTRNRPPFRAPGGDTAADAAIRMMRTMIL